MLENKLFASINAVNTSIYMLFIAIDYNYLQKRVALHVLPLIIIKSIEINQQNSK